jgi:outer membrane protein
VGAYATAVIRVQPLDQIPTPEAIGDTVDQVINRALGQRPDLIQQVAEIRSAEAGVKQAKAAYYPALSLTAIPSVPSLYGLQSLYPWAHTTDLVGELSLNLQVRDR